VAGRRWPGRYFSKKVSLMRKDPLASGLTDRARDGILRPSMHVQAEFAVFSLTRPEGSNWICAAAVWIIIVLPVCFAGLGLIARRLPGIGEVKPEALPAVGVAAFIFAGGVLNLLRAAFPPSIWILLAAGLAASAYAACGLARRPRPIGSRPALRRDKGVWLLGGVVLGVMILSAATQLAPKAYNWQDDLQKYFAHPVRMLETGTVFGSPLSAIGAESLGGLAFVQSCALLCLPIRAINGVDAILGLFLCLVPLFAFGSQHPGLRWVAAVAIASTVIIDPYYVNISALFLGSALIMAVVILTCETGAADGAFSGGSPVAAGLLYAALIALKPTFFLFVGFHLVAVACAVVLSQASLGKGLRWGATAVAGTACFLAPWILVHLPHYLAPGVPGDTSPPALVHHSIHLLGLELIDYGVVGLGAYTILAAALAALAAACLGLRPAAGPRSARNVAAAVAALVAIAAYPFMLFAFPRIVGYADADATAVRYFVPLALGIFPIVLCVGSQSLDERASALSPLARRGVCMLLGLAPLVYFSGTAAERYRDAYRYQTLLPFPGAHVEALEKVTESALGSAKQAEVRVQQDKIPPGSSLIAWIYTPYFLDYSRNTIFDAEIAGISNRWGTPPAADYILWEYRGSSDLEARTRYLAGTLPSVNRGRSAPLIEFERILSDQLRTGTVIFKNEEYVLLRTTHRGP
jgi:hypothetical protein